MRNFLIFLAKLNMAAGAAIIADRLTQETVEWLPVLVDMSSFAAAWWGLHRLTKGIDKTNKV